MAGSSALIIQELTGDKRGVELRGPALPFQGAEWAGKQRVKTTWYNGNAVEATQQVLGPIELPVTWEGVWRRTQLVFAPSVLTLNGSPLVQVARPQVLRDYLEDIFRRGARLRVAWTTKESAVGGEADVILREGRCTEWHFPHDRVEDIHWKFTFEWVSRGAVSQKAIATRENDVAVEQAKAQVAQDKLISSITHAALKTKNRKIPNSVSKLTLGQLEALTQYPNTLLNSFSRSLLQLQNQLNRVALLADKFRKIPLQLRNTALAFYQNTQAICRQFHDTMSRRPAELNDGNQRLSDITRTTTYLGDVQDNARALSRSARESEAALRSQYAIQPGKGSLSTKTTAGTVPSTILAVHIVKQGETMPYLSWAFYGTTDNAATIAQNNGLPWNIIDLKPGTILILPIIGGRTIPFGTD